MRTRASFFTLAVGTLLMALVPWLETRLVYFPSRRMVETPADYGLVYESVTLTTQDGVELAAWELPAGRDAPWLIYFHGNGENISSYLTFTSQLQALGLNILTVDYRGYGESSGRPSETGLYLDAQASYDHLRARGVAPHDIVLYGFSLGSGVAIDLASRVPVGAVIIEAAYTSIPDVVRDRYPFAPHALVRSRFNSLAKVADIDAPLLVIHSPTDRTIPFAHGQALYAAAAEPKRFLEITGSHIGVVVGLVSEPVLAGVADFLEQKARLVNRD